MPAAKSSLLMPKGSQPLHFVKRTTTSRGTRTIRASVRELGRFTVSSQNHLTANEDRGAARLAAWPPAFVTMDSCHESHPACRGQRHAPSPAHPAHAQADRADL